MMMQFTPEQIAAAQKANLETLFGLTSKAFEGVEKLVELNMQVAKTTLAEVAELEDVADLEFVRDEAPRAVERTINGVRRVSEIVAALKACLHDVLADVYAVGPESGEAEPPVAAA